MPGTKEGGIKTRDTNIKKYGKDYYTKLGALGGKVSKGGFGTETIGKDGLSGYDRAKIAGSKGGKASRRPKADRVQLQKEQKVLEYTLKTKQEQDWSDWKNKNL